MINVKRKRDDLSGLAKFSQYISVWILVRLMNVDHSDKTRVLFKGKIRRWTAAE